MSPFMKRLGLWHKKKHSTHEQPRTPESHQSITEDNSLRNAAVPSCPSPTIPATMTQTIPDPEPELEPRLPRRETLKNVALVVLQVAGDVPVPFMKIASSVLLKILQRFDDMASNKLDFEALSKDIEAFLYLAESVRNRQIPSDVVDRFQRKMKDIEREILQSIAQSSPGALINVEDQKKVVVKLRIQLQQAINLFQLDLTIAIVPELDEFRGWKASINRNAILNLERVTQEADDIQHKIKSAKGHGEMRAADGQFSGQQAISSQVSGLSAYLDAPGSKWKSSGSLSNDVTAY
ncbi:hypothetical protein D9758_010987 [Tetrapyrgos nigripes]|uniref:Uncharacterized protein n=1 Tax=Tetrapyrgos nigripes TaxID=182062 RepID=A0A8H5LPR6_9AGAR|nr:hypothetical protein D9758_010987 [Tetrapyrgos nigripes]